MSEIPSRSSVDPDRGFAIDPDDRERVARAALTHVVDPGDTRMAALVARESATEVWETLRASTRDTVWPRRARQLDLRAMVKRAQLAGVQFLIPGDLDWPNSLADLDQRSRGSAPLGLWVRGPGRLANLSAHSVAIVGSRSATSYGAWVAGDLAAELVSTTPAWVVISGGAYGIDVAAHRGAMAAHGDTVAILAGGLDRLYPRGNADLLARIGTSTLLVSESGVGAPPHKQDFLARNRLIAALSQGTVVVEGGPRSGAANTAGWAGELGRQVMAVPGPVTSAQSHTPHRLIRDGAAGLVTNAADVARLLEPLGTQPELALLEPPSSFDCLEPTPRAIREVLPARGSLSIDEISARSGFPVRTCLTALAQLADRGFAEALGAGRWALAHPGCQGAGHGAVQPSAR